MTCQKMPHEYSSAFYETAHEDLAIDRSTGKARKDKVDNYEKLAHTSFLRANRQLPVTLTQLLRASMEMHHIDELLTWLAYLIVRDLHVQVMQFWANQASSTNRASIVLRATAIQEGLLLPPHVIVNARVVEVVGYLLGERRGAELQHVYGAFSSHQADLLRRYGLNYCFGHFQSNALLLPPLANSHSSNGDIPTPFAMIALLFWRQLPFQSVLPTVITILDKVEPAAKQRNLLLSPDAGVDLQSKPTTNVQNQRFLPGSELIPRRAPDSEAMREYSPFSRVAPIRGREAQRLYLAVDGRKSLTELAALTQLNAKDMETALSQLVAQNQIQVCDRAGQPINGPWLLE